MDDETLALDVVEELGTTGSYLDHPHTLRHFREPFYSKLFDKGSFSQWEKRGSLTMEDRAAKVVAEILETHVVEPLSIDVQKQIKTIVKEQQDWIRGQHDG